MEIKDLAGLSEPLKKLIEVVSAGVGGLSKPYLIRKNADAKAYEIKVIAQAIKEHQQDLNSIEISDEKLSLMSLDFAAMKNELSLEDRTQNRISFKEQKRQKNIESITQKAVHNLEPEVEVSEIPVEDDWITRFFDYAEDISSENMQELWGRILAGEVKKPKSYSMRTLDLLRNLSVEEAEIFIKFGSLAILSGGSTFLLDFNNESDLEKQYDFNFGERLLLEELGLLAANDLSYNISKTDSSPSKTVFELGGVIVVYEKLPNKPEQHLPVLVFTKIGQELLKLINAVPKNEYLQLLATKLGRSNGTIKYANIVEELPNGQIRHTPLIDVPMTEIEVDEKRKADATTTREA